MATKRRLALLIDADNAQAALVPKIVEAVNTYGVMTIRRVYGNWSLTHLNGWKDVLHTYALEPIQQFSYVPGKNATDIALVIDAMDILYRETDVDGFCIVSSDSDFTPLVTRIRQDNRFVVGIGGRTTPATFVEACDTFVFTESFRATPAKTTVPAASPAAPTTPAPATASSDAAALEKVLRTAFAAAVQDDGWAQLGQLGNSLRQVDLSFDQRVYGHTSLSQLVAAHPHLVETQMRKTPGGGESMYIRLKKTKINQS